MRRRESCCPGRTPQGILWGSAGVRAGLARSQRFSTCGNRRRAAVQVGNLYLRGRPAWCGRLLLVAAGFLPVIKPLPAEAVQVGNLYLRGRPAWCGQGPWGAVRAREVRWSAASYPDTVSSQSANFGYVRSRSNSAAARRRRRRCRPRPPHARQSAAAARPEVSSRSNRPSD